MKKINVIKNNEDFTTIIQNANYVKNNEFVIYYRNNNLPHYRFGISVGKKIGNAVVRNYYKRIIRNICDNNKKNYSNGKDYIIIIRKACTTLSFVELENSLVELLSKIEKDR